MANKTTDAERLSAATAVLAVLGKTDKGPAFSIAIISGVIHTVGELLAAATLVLGTDDMAALKSALGDLGRNVRIFGG